MATREEILSAVKQAKPAFVKMPAAFASALSCDWRHFIESAKANGSAVVEMINPGELEKWTRNRFAGKSIASKIIASDVQIDDRSNIGLVATVEVAVLESYFGVAENGSLLLREDQMLHRALPFLCEHLVLTVNKNKLVADMHEACSFVPGDGYCVFISAPSKTADIEQALVIGAHGPKTLAIIIIG
jgi:L-lactate dehydrogenase complex protein LldG